jgi:hypothetical protein
LQRKGNVGAAFGIWRNLSTNLPDCFVENLSKPRNGSEKPFGYTRSRRRGLITLNRFAENLRP